MDDKVRYEGNEGTSDTPCPSPGGGVGKGESITVQSACGRVDKKENIKLSGRSNGEGDRVDAVSSKISRYDGRVRG